MACLRPLWSYEKNNSLRDYCIRQPRSADIRHFNFKMGQPITKIQNTIITFGFCLYGLVFKRFQVRSVFQRQILGISLEVLWVGCFSCRQGDSAEARKRVKVKGKGFPYSIPSVGPGADPGIQAISPQVTASHPPCGKLSLSARPAVTFPASEHHRRLAGTKVVWLVGV